MKNLSSRQVSALLEYCAACGSYEWASEKLLPSVDSLRDAVSVTQEVCVRGLGLDAGVLRSFLDVYLDAFEASKDSGHTLQCCHELAHRAFLCHLENRGVSL